MKILIVEDEIELLDSMASYLKNEDFICEKATNFFDVGYLKKYSPDVVSRLYDRSQLLLKLNIIEDESNG